MNTKSIKSALLILTLAIIAGCTSTASDPTVGAWDMSMTTPVGEMPFVLTIMDNNSGTMVGDDFSNPVSDIVSEGDTLAFSATLSVQGQSIPLTFTGSVVADALTGEFGSSFGPVPVSGTRQ